MRYHLFGGTDFYYASGGGHDFICARDSVDLLIQYVEANVFEDEFGDKSDLAWWHIWDTEKEEIIMGTEPQAYGASDLKGDKIYNSND